MTDGAAEYISQRWEAWLQEQGVKHEISSPYALEENGKAERVWGTIIGMARCMIHKAGAPTSYWSFALLPSISKTDVFILRSPYIAFHKTKPDVSNLKKFRSIVYVYVERQREKLDEKAKRGVFLGYHNTSNSYTVGYCSGIRFAQHIIDKKVTFGESKIFFKHSVQTPAETNEIECELTTQY